MDDFTLAFCFALMELAYLNTMRTSKNWEYFFADAILTSIFNCCFSIRILPKCLLKGSLNNKRTLRKTVARRRTGDKPISEQMRNWLRRR